MSRDPDGSPLKDPWWLFPGSRPAACSLAGLWLTVAALALAQLILSDSVGVRWASGGQLVGALVLALNHLRSSRYDGPRAPVRPSTSRWGAGRPEERWR